jgi:hypothetical protein
VESTLLQLQRKTQKEIEHFYQLAEKEDQRVRKIALALPLEIKKLTLKKPQVYKTYKQVQSTLAQIKQKCENPRNPAYHCYGGRGIKCFLTYGQLLELWERDHADKMKQPSIDRFDPRGHYLFSNCRFIELSENSRRAVEYRIKQKSYLS